MLGFHAFTRTSKGVAILLCSSFVVPMSPNQRIKIDVSVVVLLQIQVASCCLESYTLPVLVGFGGLCVACLFYLLEGLIDLCSVEPNRAIRPNNTLVFRIINADNLKELRREVIKHSWCMKFYTNQVKTTSTRTFFTFVARVVLSISCTNLSFINLGCLWILRLNNALHISLRRQNTGHKNPKLIAHHCFVSGFWSMFFVFNLAGSTCRATKTFVAG